MRLLEKVEASARPQMIPLLRAWAEIDYKKVRARIAAVIRSIESKGGAVGGAAQADTNELIDVLDPAGHPTGLAKPKHAIHSEGAWHRAVHLWIVTPDRSVLLQRRSFAKMAWPGWWDISVAGHLSAGESAADAAVREAREELGLDLRTEELVPLATVREQSVFDDGRWIENEIQEVYVVRRYIDLRSLSPDHAEVIDLMLVSMGDLDRADIVPHVGEIEALLRFVEAI
jgi:isopentenyldiphosphate isomerase